MPFFVIHEHHARRLHYDLRLEIGRVLKSWAVPKGPSMDPSQKRLAIQVDDHPVEYAEFEGIIPEGRYGAGPVVIWDRGNFEWLEPGNPDVQVESGRLSIELMGGKLKGGFSLTRMRGRGTGKEWLLIKKKDFHAEPSWKLKPALNLEKRRQLKVRIPPCEAS
jgi:bifunctional non-homologous end joining protein LigD